ncbi:SDR family NAD(P)-dependent oxidoreductase [Ruegeria faecimaris]|uniref:NAD(P)-dependent dehydrogenase, short-chain alcohol dehydrogenase family n=1 Tax=Ruegeria faecimaris TaxID=686389 RepID=A0A521EJN1_9RHOB|nr:SDR family NAD(P)-dependent oxidoreductase [Ruegeria faecimaris]SMO84126.1 NAD(P)-dependent dehydrogenase, short-chain alcohol dehydrogenase family [Ruegeria faecimaris]
MDIEGLSAIVTGAGSGLGLATAQALSKAGARVTLLDLDEVRVKNAAAEIGALGVGCDVINSSAVEAALDLAEDRSGPIRIVVNCAGIPGGMRLVGRDGPVDMEAFARVINVNLMGTVSVMTKCAARMMQQEPLNQDGERGIIINTGSITSIEGQIGQGAYVASKGAIASLTLQAAREFMPRGVRVMTIAPGLFRTPIADHIPQEVIDGMLDGRMFPNRFGEPAEFGRLAVNIIQNPMLNGETIRLDAGVRLQAG